MYLFLGAGSLLLCSGLLQLQRVGATLRCRVQASHCSGFSRCRAETPGTWASVFAAQGLSMCSTWALVAHGTCSLPGPGIEPVSPALSGGFLSTAPPRKSLNVKFKEQHKRGHIDTYIATLKCEWFQAYKKWPLAKGLQT